MTHSAHDDGYQSPDDEMSDMEVYRVAWEGKTFEVAGRLDGTLDFVVPDVGSYPLRLADAEAMIVALCSAVADVHRASSLDSIV